MAFDSSKLSGFLSTSAQMRIQYGAERVPLTPMSKTLHQNLVVDKGVSVDELQSTIETLPEDEQAVMNDVMEHMKAFM